jgi:hypothetical protein
MVSSIVRLSFSQLVTPPAWFSVLPYFGFLCSVCKITACNVPLFRPLCCLSSFELRFLIFPLASSTFLEREENPIVMYCFKNVITYFKSNKLHFWIKEPQKGIYLGMSKSNIIIYPRQGNCHINVTPSVSNKKKYIN